MADSSGRLFRARSSVSSSIRVCPAIPIFPSASFMTRDCRRKSPEESSRVWPGRRQGGRSLSQRARRGITTSTGIGHGRRADRGMGSRKPEVSPSTTNCAQRQSQFICGDLRHDVQVPVPISCIADSTETRPSRHLEQPGWVGPPPMRVDRRRHALTVQPAIFPRGRGRQFRRS